MAADLQKGRSIQTAKGKFEHLCKPIIEVTNDTWDLSIVWCFILSMMLSNNNKLKLSLSI